VKLRILTAIAVVGASAVAAATLGAPASAASAEMPVVVELFVSQACKESPKAASHLADLSTRPDLVVLTWHVDYWNVLSNRKHGRWKDPFARPEFAVRQRIYNRQIRDRGSVYTPQAVVNGAGTTVGSKAKQLAEMIEDADVVQRPADISFDVRGDSMTISTRSAGETREAFLVRFHDMGGTQITGGDNAGVFFREPNVVTELVRLGYVNHSTRTYTVKAPAPGMGCAVLIQERGQGAITAAKYCP
jgi:hypothetical protein